MNGFPSPLRGLIFHSPTGTEDTLSFAVSVPSSGTYLPFYNQVDNEPLEQHMVSVPSSGTYLPFEHTKSGKSVKCRFRPLFGDLSSIRLRNPHGLSVLLSFRPLFGDLSSILSVMQLITKQLSFPSPLRGLIFHSDVTHCCFVILCVFPSPLRGLIFHSENRNDSDNKKVSVPSSGTYLPFRQLHRLRNEEKRFRPLFGDLSSIPRWGKLDCWNK